MDLRHLPPFTLLHSPPWHPPLPTHSAIRRSGPTESTLSHLFPTRLCSLTVLSLMPRLFDDKAETCFSVRRFCFHSRVVKLALLLYSTAARSELKSFPLDLQPLWQDTHVLDSLSSLSPYPVALCHFLSLSLFLCLIFCHYLLPALCTSGAGAFPYLLF